MDDQAKAAENLRIAEFDSLQAQINPHFLYNTMDMISWLAQQGKSDEVTEVVRRLSRFYRLTLSRKQELTTIADEAEHVTIYIELQNHLLKTVLYMVSWKKKKRPDLSFLPVGWKMKILCCSSQMTELALIRIFYLSS